MRELMSPALTMRTAPEWPGGGEFHGYSEFEGFMDQFEESWGQVTYETLGEPEVLGEALLWPSRWKARGLSSGIETEVDFWGVFRFEGGRVSRLDFFFDRDAALEFARSLAPPAE
jgi:hypothetical protein